MRPPLGWQRPRQRVILEGFVTDLVILSLALQASAHEIPMKEEALSTSAMQDERVRSHWSNFIYKHTARHWHALWCRWKPNGDLITEFHAERKFTPLDDKDGCAMQVIYHYHDERGTVSTGPPCGPWEITTEQSQADDKDNQQR